MSLEQYNVQTNPFSALQSAIKGSGNSPRANLMHALILNQAHHASVMEHLERSSQLSKEEMTHKAGLDEQAAVAQHGRTKEMITSIHKAAEPGTKMDIALGDSRFSLITKKRRVRAPKPDTTAATPVAATEAPVEKTQKFAYNHPVTGAITYGTAEEKAKALSAKRVKKAAPRKKK